MSGDTQLELWLQGNSKRFWSPTIGQVWHGVYAAYSGDGGRMNESFVPAVKLLGFAVRPVASGGYILVKVKP